MSQEEKRKFTRVPFTKSVKINNSIQARCSDISEGGVFVHLTRAVMPGDTVKVAFPSGLTVQAVVQVVSAHGTGLMFTALKPDQAAEIKAIVGQHTTVAPVRKALPCVLMVEDSENVRRLARSSLEAQGLGVLEASDGLAALKVLGDEVPDIILLDLHMEKMDGYKLLSYIKQIDQLKNIPVIVFSSKFSAEEQVKVRAAGADEFLPKMTTSPMKLVAIIKKYLEKSQK